MSHIKVNINDGTNSKSLEFEVSDSNTLLYHLRGEGLYVDSPCNGNGTCGKCAVRILKNCPEASEKEISLLGKAAVEAGYRLACRLTVNTDLELAIGEQNTGAKIVTEGIIKDFEVKPIVLKVNLTLDKPEISDQRDDLSRIPKEVSDISFNNLNIIRSLPAVIREGDYNVTFVCKESGTLAVEAGDTTKELFGAAVDIGTTTLACYLVDLVTGKRLSVNSLLNPQKIYGADVISRIKHTMDNENGIEELQSLVINAINASITVMCSQTGIKPENIYALTLVGNTTMLHLLAGVSPRYIATSPFTPAFTSALNLTAEELGVSVNPSGLICLLPSVSAYIGADTVAAVLSSGMNLKPDISLLIDIGTNGEIVLGNSEFLYACSSAAGPAFEGANIRNGMGSITGAISRISLKQGLSCSTIGDSRPIGICGTGVVDLLAQLLELGIVDETGRLASHWAPGTNRSDLQESADPTDVGDLAHRAHLAALAQRITTVDGMNAFVLYGAEETPTGRDIAVTQRDIRELQNAKAAIAAGISVLVKEAGINFEDIKKVYLAGGFGSYINIESALKIGLIPSALKGKIISIGNAAGQGAVEALLNRDSLLMAEEISKKIKYIELSASKDFNDLYVECMLFEE